MTRTAHHDQMIAAFVSILLTLTILARALTEPSVSRSSPLTLMHRDHSPLDFIVRYILDVRGDVPHVAERISHTA
jgi:hypothetical protein